MTLQATASSFDPDLFIHGFFEIVDQMDGQGLRPLLDPDVTLAFASWPPVEGRDAVIRSIDDFYGTITSLRHRIDRVWMVGETVVSEGRVFYRDRWQRPLDVPFANIFGMHAGAVKDFRIYIDNSALFRAPDA